MKSFSIGSVSATAIAFSVCIFTTSVNASLIGDTITASGTGNLVATGTDLTSATIGANIEFTGLNNFMNFDFDANSLTLTSTLVLWRGFGDYVFSAFDENIVSVSIVTNTGFEGSIINNFSFDSNSITLDMSDSTRLQGSILVFDIQTSAVPVPAALWLFGSGLLGLIGVARRKRWHT